MKLKRNNYNLYLLDAEDMYPSIKTSMIKRLIKFYWKGMSRIDKNKIKLGIEFIQFEMSKTLLTLDGKCWKCDREEYKKDKKLAIGGHESTYLANLVVLFIFENT